MDHYPNNSASHYYTELPQHIDLSSIEYEIGLAEIQFPNTYTNIDGGWIQIAHEELEPARQIPIPNGLYDSPSTLVTTLNDIISNYHHPENTTNIDITFSYSKPARIASIELNVKGSRLRLSPQIGALLGMNDSLMFGPGKFIGSRMADIHNNSYAVYVYCDLVSARPVGDMMVPLLRIIPTVDKTKDIIHRTYEKPHYLTLNRHQFNVIEIILRTDTGQSPAFATGTSVVTLHFRPKRNR